MPARSSRCAPRRVQSAALSSGLAGSRPVSHCGHLIPWNIERWARPACASPRRGSARCASPWSANRPRSTKPPRSPCSPCHRPGRQLCRHRVRLPRGEQRSRCRQSPAGRLSAQVHVATKSPVWMVKETADFDRFLNEQLVRLQTDHIDFYLLHCLQENSWLAMQQLGVLEWGERAPRWSHRALRFLVPRQLCRFPADPRRL